MIIVHAISRFVRPRPIIIQNFIFLKNYPLFCLPVITPLKVLESEKIAKMSMLMKISQKFVMVKCNCNILQWMPNIKCSWYFGNLCCSFVLKNCWQWNFAINEVNFITSYFCFIYLSWLVSRYQDNSWVWYLILPFS